jgi:hypothetical protein
VLLVYEKVLLRVRRLNEKKRFTSVDIALIGVFCALWVVLNVTLGPLGFAWFGLPIFCDFAVFSTLLLITWATGKFGATALVGAIGSSIILLLRTSPTIIGFAVSAIVFDVLMSANHHKLCMKAYDIIVAAFATAVSAYFAGVIIGVLFMRGPFDWALTFWGGWHLVGGIISVAITLPIIGILEKANMRKITSV